MAGKTRADYKKTQAAYASEYGVSIRTIKRWQAKGYPLDDPAKLGELLGQQKSAPEGLLEGGPKNLKDRKLLVECQRSELRLGIERGEVTPNIKIREDLTRIATATRAELMRLENDLPGTLAGLDSAAIQIKIREALDIVFRNLADATSHLYIPPTLPPQLAVFPVDPLEIVA